MYEYSNSELYKFTSNFIDQSSTDIYKCSCTNQDSKHTTNTDRKDHDLNLKVKVVQVFV